MKILLKKYTKNSFPMEVSISCFLIYFVTSDLVRGIWLIHLVVMGEVLALKSILFKGPKILKVEFFYRKYLNWLYFSFKKLG